MFTVIKSDKQYNEYLLMIEQLMEIAENDLSKDQADQLELLSLLVEDFERSRYSIIGVDPALPEWLFKFQSMLERTELDDSETAMTEFMRGYYCGCRDTKIQIAGQLLFHMKVSK
jgi:hypothetical protein